MIQRDRTLTYKNLEELYNLGIISEQQARLFYSGRYENELDEKLLQLKSSMLFFAGEYELAIDIFTSRLTKPEVNEDKNLCDLLTKTKFDRTEFLKITKRDDQLKSLFSFLRNLPNQIIAHQIEGELTKNIITVNDALKLHPSLLENFSSSTVDRKQILTLVNKKEYFSAVFSKPSAKATRAPIAHQRITTPNPKISKIIIRSSDELTQSSQPFFPTQAEKIETLYNIGLISEEQKKLLSNKNNETLQLIFQDLVLKFLFEQYIKAFENFRVRIQNPTLEENYSLVQLLKRNSFSTEQFLQQENEGQAIFLFSFLRELKDQQLAKQIEEELTKNIVTVNDLLKLSADQLDILQHNLVDPNMAAILEFVGKGPKKITTNGASIIRSFETLETSQVYKASKQDALDEAPPYEEINVAVKDLNQIFKVCSPTPIQQTTTSTNTNSTTALSNISFKDIPEDLGFFLSKEELAAQQEILESFNKNKASSSQTKSNNGVNYIIN
jgi:hypothetical protein